MIRRNPSQYLTFKELDCKDGTPYPDEFIMDGRLHRLAHTFDNIRRLIGNHPLIVHSAYRTAEYNQKVGGAVSSQHVRGRALDISCKHVGVIELFQKIHINADALGVRGLGLYRTFVHFDIRTTELLVTWNDYANADKTSRG